MTAPETELSVGSVHIANFASQTFVVTYEKVAFMGQIIHKLAENSPRACCFFLQQRIKFVDMTSFVSFGPNVCLHQR